jgi:hypothetical protein
MAIREIDKDHQARDEDWYGNNAAFTCPLCSKVFIVSQILNEPGEPKGRRKCPSCGKSTGIVDANGARVEWFQN